MYLLPPAPELITPIYCQVKRFLLVMRHQNGATPSCSGWLQSERLRSRGFASRAPSGSSSKSTSGSHTRRAPGHTCCCRLKVDAAFIANPTRPPIRSSSAKLPLLLATFRIQTKINIFCNGIYQTAHNSEIKAMLRFCVGRAVTRGHAITRVRVLQSQPGDDIQDGCFPLRWSSSTKNSPSFISKETL